MLQAPSVPSRNPHQPASVAHPAYYGMPMQSSPQQVPSDHYPVQAHRGSPNVEHPSYYSAAHGNTSITSPPLHQGAPNMLQNQQFAHTDHAQSSYTQQSHGQISHGENGRTACFDPSMQAKSYRVYDCPPPPASGPSQMNGSSGLGFADDSGMPAHYHPQWKSTVAIPSSQQLPRRQYQAPVTDPTASFNDLPSYQSYPIAPISGAQHHRGDGRQITTSVTDTNSSMVPSAQHSSSQPMYQMTQPEVAHPRAPIIYQTSPDGAMPHLNSSVGPATGGKRQYDWIAEDQTVTYG
ncbi:hypothetical protein GGR57DRAFT_333903 [Xylariaceae sp. FL1272]|nr:hypothetical protein GGR57DRAFT_333903 [Xylariaceae sp. FL1272]